MFICTSSGRHVDLVMPVLFHTIFSTVFNSWSK